MPTYGYCSVRPCSIDPRRWERCKKQAREALIAGGFDRLSKKLDDAVHKRALRLFRTH